MRIKDGIVIKPFMNVSKITKGTDRQAVPFVMDPAQGEKIFLALTAIRWDNKNVT